MYALFEEGLAPLSVPTATILQPSVAVCVAAPLFVKLKVTSAAHVADVVMAVNSNMTNLSMSH